MWHRHEYIAGNPKRDGHEVEYRLACQKKGCGAPAVMTVFEDAHGKAIEVVLYEVGKHWRGKGEVPSWAKIAVT